jgi:hypothetical protein
MECRPSQCPLCKSNHIEYIFHQKQFKRDFYRCESCFLHFIDPGSLLKPEDEQQRYEHHQNSEKDPGYVAFLSRLLDPVMKYVSIHDQGLDYGSGPYPMMQEIAIERGLQMDIYDPFFANDTTKLDKKYDYLTCCEVVEHFHHPANDFDQLIELLLPGGLLGIMTSILYESIDLPSWHYIHDETHVSLYAPKTMEWIAKNYGLQLLEMEGNVTIFRKV